MDKIEKKSFQELFLEHKGRLIDKWSGYLDIYDRHLDRYRDRPIKVLEIGVYHGGSLQLLKKYFGEAAMVIGVDIDPGCAGFAEDRVSVEIGDQSSQPFWQSFFERHGEFDVIIDDGSHISEHQIVTLLMAWPHLRDGGTYLVEDLHCAYWAGYFGGYRSKVSFIEFAKDRVDDMNAFWSKDGESFVPNEFTKELGALTFYDSIAVFEKTKREHGMVRVVAGTHSRPLSEGEAKVYGEARANAEKLKGNAV